ncbi:glycosyltransferase family 4 protein [Dongia soli]|uniref:Glycosyltransferase family 4 protein n=1 Tax=Dongia soli TaxID=600628 RepID=A0ABU5EB72_9PROT|nr:glycosyltransferase family 4 protein [Dongia soli]MDY0882768.1 glycosyltransferase family 4 protein [Dongia soli]
MRILFLTHYFPPEVNAPASRTYEHCRRWVEAGADVTVITCVPNHPRGVIFPGYRNRLWQRDQINGIDVVRVWTFATANEGFLLRTLNYVVFMLMSIAASCFVKRPDVVISTSPQFFAGLAGYVTSRLRRTRWILEIRDLWPESILAVGAIKSKAIIGLLEWLERFAYRKADQIVVVTESFVQHVASHGGTRERIAVITNGVDLSTFQRRERDVALAQELGLGDKFVAAYVGTHGMAHGLKTILEAAEILRHRSDIAILMVGDGAAKAALKEERDQRGLSNVVMLDELPKDKMAQIWSISDASLVLLRNLPLFSTVIPSKIFESMAMERPIILGVVGESARIIEAAQSGILIKPESAEELSAAIRTLADNREHVSALGRHGADYVRTHYDRDKLAATFLDIIRRVAQTTTASDRRRHAGAPAE